MYEEYTEMMRPLGDDDILKVIGNMIELDSKKTHKKVIFYIKSIDKQQYGNENIIVITSSDSKEPLFLGYLGGKRKRLVVQNQAFEWNLKRVEGVNGYNIMPDDVDDECLTLFDNSILSISECRIEYSRQIFVFEDEPYSDRRRYEKYTRRANKMSSRYYSDSSSDLAYDRNDNYYSKYAEDDSSHEPTMFKKMKSLPDSSDSDDIKELLEPSIVIMASDMPKSVNSTTTSSINTYSDSMSSPIPVTVSTSVLISTSVLTSTSISTVLVQVTKTIDEQAITIINEPIKNAKPHRCVNKNVLPSIISASDVCNENESNSSSESLNESNYYQNDLKHYNNLADMRIQDIKSLNDMKTFSLNEFPVLKKFISLYETDSNTQIQSTITNSYPLSITTVV
ncbi:hypothetical protein OCOL_000837 [Ordospora colligata]